MDIAILNRNQMTRTTPDLAPSSPSFRTTPTRGRLTHVMFSVYRAHKRGGSSEESDFEPRALRLRYRELTTRWYRFPLK
ncbi:hypothetical protein AVEN_197471-1 [Araneus ventricosus]|uniref:Uncharacterized protein n=1 Tax=Araneus ventricosus TaxID=182803 RepID=A0A4Y2VCK4_ARAVE|nr:hypothetical protein AVEN_197471-1 [Araneus ventricosus]